MAEEILRSRHAFGSSENLDAAIEEEKIDALDILFLDGNTNNPKIGWIDKDGNKIILEDKTGVIAVEELPATGDTATVYICNSKFYFWDGSAFVSPTSEGELDESTVDEKISSAITTANDYTDEQINTVISSMAIVEF